MGRSAASAVSFHTAPASLAGYWRQHVRWARGFNDVAGLHVGQIITEQRLPYAVRLELLLFTIGYLDRVATLIGGLLASIDDDGRFLRYSLTISLLTPLAQVLGALHLDGSLRRLGMRIVVLPVFYPVDVAMAAVGAFEAVRRAPRLWEERRERR